MVLCIWAPATYAQVALENFSKKLAELPLLSVEEFYEKTELFTEISPEDQSLHYRVRLPKGWTSRGALSVSGDKSVIGELGSYVGPSRVEHRSTFQVLTQDLEFEMPVKFWFLQYVLDNGYALQGVTEFEDGHIEAIYVIVERGVDYVVRVKAVRNDTRIIVGQYTMPIEKWDAEKVMQSQALRSFELLHRSKGVIEDTRSHQFLDISRFTFPESWAIESPPVRNADRMRAKLTIRRPFGNFSGEIEIHGVSVYAAESLSQEVGRFQRSLAQRGLGFGDLIEQRRDITTSRDAKGLVLEAYKATDDSGRFIDYEFWFTILQIGDYYYFATLLTPSRDQEVRDWVRNTQSYYQVIESVSLAKFSHGLGE